MNILDSARDTREDRYTDTRFVTSQLPDSDYSLELLQLSIGTLPI